MLKKLALLPFIGLFSLSLPAAYADSANDLDEFRSQLTNEWLLIKNDRRRDIKTYVRLEDAKRYRSFKIEATFESSVEALIRVLLDFKNYDRWFWEARGAKQIRQHSPTEYLMYMIHDAPYGLPDRDTILKVTIEPQSKNKPHIVVRMTAVPDALPTTPPLVRMIAEEITAKVTVLPQNKVQMTIEGYFDPGGVVPAWAANFVQRNAPYAVLVALQRSAQKPEYNDNSASALPFPIYNYENLP